MRFRSSRLVPALFLSGALLWIASPALAAETSNSEFVIIREDDVVSDDLYAGAIRVVIEGTLDGDLTAFAADEVIIDGTITGSVIAVAPRVTINGTVGGSLRVSGNSLSVTGSVDHDVVAAVWSAALSPESTVGGDVLIWAWRAEALGSIGADLTGTQRNLSVAGDVGGDIDVSVGRLTVVDPLRVGGDLDYRSRRDARGLDDADVQGAIVSKTPLEPNLRLRALGLLGRFMVVLFLTVAALTAAYGWPSRASSAIVAVGRKPIRSWLRGAAVMFAPLLLAAITGVMLGVAPAAAAFPLLAVLAPVILAALGLSFALALVAGAPVVGWIGGTLFKRLEMYGSIVVGAVVVGVLWYLPFVGWAVPIVVLPLGLGAWFSTFNQSSAEVPSGSSESISTHSTK